MRECCSYGSARGALSDGRPYHDSEFSMQAEREDRDRSTLPVVARIVDELIIAGDLAEAEGGVTYVSMICSGPASVSCPSPMIPPRPPAARYSLAALDI